MVAQAVERFVAALNVTLDTHFLVLLHKVVAENVTARTEFVAQEERNATKKAAEEKESVKKDTVSEKDATKNDAEKNAPVKKDTESEQDAIKKDDEENAPVEKDEANEKGASDTDDKAEDKKDIAAEESGESTDEETTTSDITSQILDQQMKKSKEKAMEEEFARKINACKSRESTDNKNSAAAKFADAANKMKESAEKTFNNFKKFFGGRRRLSKSCAAEAAEEVGSMFGEVVDANEAEKKAAVKEVHDRRASLNKCIRDTRGKPVEQRKCMSNVWGNKDAAVEVEEKLMAERKRKEKDDLENLVGGLLGFKNEKDKDVERDIGDSSNDSTEAATKVLSARKKDELKKQMWGVGQLKGTLTEAGVQLDNKLKSIAASAAATTLKSCKDDKFYCNMKAKEEAEKRYGKLDDISFKAIKDEATEDEIENAVRNKMKYMLNGSSSGSSNTEASTKGETPNKKAQKSVFNTVWSSIRNSLASLEATTKVAEHKVNKYLERMKESAVLTGASLAPEEASIEIKREYIATQLKRIGTFVERTASGELTRGAEAQVASLQRKGAEKEVQSVFTSQECVNGATACLEAAKSSAAKALGRLPSNVELQRMRQRAAVGLASNVQSSCDDMETPVSECAAQTLSKMKQITGDMKITATKVQKYKNFGARESAARNMRSCLTRLEGLGTRAEIYKNCSLENRNVIAATLGRDPSKVTRQKAYALRMRGAYMHVRQMIESCVEVAATSSEKRACRSRKAMEDHRRAFYEMTGPGTSSTEEMNKDKKQAEAGTTTTEVEAATADVETLRETDVTAFTEAATASDLEASASLSEIPSEEELIAAEKNREAMLIEEMEKSTGLKLNDEESENAEFLYLELKEESEATRLEDMARACEDASEAKCDLETGVFLLASPSDSPDGIANTETTLHAAKIRRFWKSQRNVRKCAAGDKRKKCEKANRGVGEKLGFGAHRLGAMKVATAKSAAAEAWADAINDGMSENDAKKEAKAAFMEFASSELFQATVKAVKKLAEVKAKVGEKTEIVQSKTEIVSVLTITRGKRECDQKTLNMVKTIIARAASDGETNILAQGLAPDGISCEAVFSTKVVEGADLEKVSKNIHTKVDRDLKRRRRLGDSEGTVMSSSPREEEVPYGERMESAVESPAPASQTGSDESDSSRESVDDEDESMLFELSSLGHAKAGGKINARKLITMLCVIVAATFAFI
eukprot:g275.t1